LPFVIVCPPVPLVLTPDHTGSVEVIGSSPISSTSFGSAPHAGPFAFMGPPGLGADSTEAARARGSSSRSRCWSSRTGATGVRMRGHRVPLTPRMAPRQGEPDRLHRRDRGARDGPPAGRSQAGVGPRSRVDIRPLPKPCLTCGAL